MSNVVEELTDAYKIGTRATIDDQCLLCPKKHKLKVIPIEDKETAPPLGLMMVHAEPLCTVCVEVSVDDRFYYLFYKCEDEFCLLNHLREGVMNQWLANLQKAQERQIEADRFAAMHAHKMEPSRKANKRRKAKQRAKSKR